MRVHFFATIVALFLFTVLTAGEESAAENDNEATQQTISEPPIKLVHVLNPGEREYLSPNLIGVQNIAMTFMPLSMNFINIIDAFREIVNGVRYEIHLNAVDTKDNNAEKICRLVILEKPWLTTEWGGKVRELQHSNCTSEADNLTLQAGTSEAPTNKYQRNAVFSGGSRNELTDEEMSKLESQIVLSGSPKAVKRRTTTTTSTTTTTTEQSVTAVKSETLNNAKSDNNDDDASSDESQTLSTEDDVTTVEATTQLPELSDVEVKLLDDIFSVGALNFENSRRDKETQNNNVANNSDDENNSLQQAASTVSNESLIENDEGEQSQHEDLSEQFEKTAARTKRSNTLVGGPSKIDNKDAEKRLQTSLDKLATGDGPSYRISKIHSATTQVVSGSLTKIDAELIDGDDFKERCQIDIWSQPWLPDGTEVTIDCPSKKQVKKRLSRSVEYAEKKTHKKHDHHNLNKVEHIFGKFQIKYNRRYHTTMEHQMRLRIFRQNLKTIEELNRNEMGSAKYGITEFADMTSSEYKERTGLWQREEKKPNTNAQANIPDVELPKEFDWREKGVISEVKNQGSCGSCWAFSVTGNIEGLHAVKTGKLEEYSEQELLDCDTTDSACNGGLPDNAYEAILKIGGLELESEYPYKGRKEQCQFNKTRVHVRVKGAVDLPKNETAIAQWLITNGPISIGINANAMQFYRGGVSHPWHALCSHSNLDHGVLIVGYGISDYPMFKKTLPYWIIKNSWGKKWGEQGYYRVYRGDNTCGVSEMASSAVLAED